MRCAPAAWCPVRAASGGTPHAPHRRASQAIEESTGKIYNGKGKDGKKIDKGHRRTVKAPPPPWALADLGACATSGRPRRL